MPQVKNAINYHLSKLKLETDPTKFFIVLTGFYRIKKPCCEELLDSQPAVSQVHMNGRCREHA